MLKRIAFLAIALVAQDFAAEAQTQQIKIAVGAPQVSPVWRGAEMFRDEVNRRLEGRARVELLPPNVSINALNAVRTGEVQMAVVSTTALAASKTASFALFDLPFFFRSLEETAAVQESVVGEIMLGAVKLEGIGGLAFWNIGMSQLFGRKEILEINHLKGAKIRTTTSQFAQDAVRQLGIVTTQVAFGEVSSALDRGVIDIVETPAIFAAEDGLGLRPTVYSNVNYRPVVSVVVVNDRFWKNATLRIQSVFVEQSHAVARSVTKDAMAREEAATKKLQGAFKLVTATPLQLEAFSQAAAFSWRGVESLQTDGFLNTAVNVRDELRRTKPAPSPANIRKGEGNQTGVTIAFATDRRDDMDSDPAYRFGGARGLLSWGEAKLVIQADRRLGSGDVASVRLTGFTDKRTEGDIINAVNARLQSLPQKEVLIYIHGFNTTFKNAVTNATQILTDTKFLGPTIVFSWPSDGALMSYFSDGEEVLGSRRNFIALLRALTAAGVSKIHVLAHSMGSRLVVGSLELLEAQSSNNRPRLYHLILAAPDSRTHDFMSAASGLKALAKRVTLYSSDRDQALACATMVYNAPRAGQGGTNVVVVDEIDTVDISPVESSTWWAWMSGAWPCTPAGHSYVSQNEAVLADLYTLLTYDTAPGRRHRLHQKDKSGLPYWEMR